MRTRFAPSPTGYLHIGGVRTALFNWLLAKQSGGQFILRIDDTDAERNVAEALQPILDGFRWLGMNWDEGPDVDGPHAPYFQSQRGSRYQEAVDQLLKSGHAYQDFSTPDEYKAQRDAAKEAGTEFVYDRKWMAEDDAAAKAFEDDGRTSVVRLKMPREGTCVINDLVKGEVRFDWIKEADHVIQRTDGSCLYHLASAVDDADFEITHVVRGDDHLSNTPRQIFIAESLGFDRPAYAHLPYVAEPGGTAKLSKRKLKKYLKNKDFADLLSAGNRIADECHLQPSEDTFNPVLVDFYAQVGFVPGAVLNYLLLLGWSLDGEREKFSVQEMIKLFSLDRVNQSPSSFDPQKLLAFQGDAFAALPLDERIARVIPFAEAAGFVSDDASRELLRQVVDSAGDRLKLAGDIIDFAYCFTDEFPYDEKAFQKRVVKPDDAVPLLSKLRDHLSEASDFGVEACENAVKGFCETEGIQLKQIIHALRIAVTGVPSGFGMFETLAILGKDKVVQRIETTVRKADSSS